MGHANSFFYDHSKSPLINYQTWEEMLKKINNELYTLKTIKTNKAYDDTITEKLRSELKLATKKPAKQRKGVTPAKSLKQSARREGSEAKLANISKPIKKMTKTKQN